MNINSDDSLGYIKLSFGPKWKYVACVRSFVQNFLTITLTDNQKSDKISMAVSELVENAVKYNAKEKTAIFLKLLSQETEEILVEVENYATPEQIQVLKKELSKIYQKSPMDAYIDKMREAVNKEGTSQLGLARIRCEANCDIKLKVEADGIITVRAIFH
jgi:hypothetical protein